MIAYLEEIDIRSHLSDSGMPSELDTTCFVALIQVQQRQATGQTRPLRHFFSKLILRGSGLLTKHWYFENH